MRASKYGILIGVSILIMVSSLFGGHFGYDVAGVPQGGGWESEDPEDIQEPGILSALGWAWDAVVFLFHMMTFQIDGMPEFVSALFIIVGLLIVVIIVSLVRGTD